MSIKLPLTGHASSRVTALAALLIAVLVAQTHTVPRAAANGYWAGPATPTNEHLGGHWWASNGCGSVGTAFVPDRVPGTFDFRHACVHHDGCYGQRYLNRLGCDNRFRSDMRASCEAGAPYTYWWNRPACRAAAELYYSAVRTFGVGAYG